MVRQAGGHAATFYNALGNELRAVPGYTFRVFVTYTDLAADDFCTQPFFATEAAFLAVVATLNLLRWFQQVSGQGEYRQPATLRAQVFFAGRCWVGTGEKPGPYLSLSWDGLERLKPLREAISQWQKPTAEKLDSSRSILSLSA